MTYDDSNSARVPGDPFADMSSKLADINRALGPLAPPSGSNLMAEPGIYRGLGGGGAGAGAAAPLVEPPAVAEPPPAVKPPIATPVEVPPVAAPPAGRRFTGSSYTPEEAPPAPPPVGHNEPPEEYRLTPEDYARTPLKIPPRPGEEEQIEATAKPADEEQPVVTSLKDTRPLAEQEAGWGRFDQWLKDRGIKPGGPEQPPAPAAPPAEEAPPAAPAAQPAKQPPLLKQDEPFGPDNPVGTHPQEEALTVNDILHPDTPAPYDPRTRGVEEIAGELDDRGQAALKALGVKGGRIDGPDPDTDELLARSMASEVSAALDRPGANASDWYTGKIKEAVDVASVMHPEIATDPGAKDAFRAALAITSQGEKVPSNTKLAEQAYQVFKDTGKFPENVNAKEGPSINGNFAKLNRLIDAQGWDETRAFLDEPTTVRDLKNKGYEVGSSESMDTPVWGSHILGAKIGNGFYQNLGGNYEPTTFDLWWMRQWGRKTGTLTGKPDTSAQRERLENALADEGMKVPKTANGLDTVAQQTWQEHQRNFDKYRQEYEPGPNGEPPLRTKSELVYASNRWLQARTGINNSPTSGGQRTWMRSVVDRARQILASQGRTMTNADLQAILWYPEKDLYAKMGGKPSDDLNVDYATALRNLAKSKGFTDEQLSQAGKGVLPASGGSGSAPPSNVGAGNAGGGAPSGAGAGGPQGSASSGPGGPQAFLGTPVAGDPYSMAA